MQKIFQPTKIRSVSKNSRVFPGDNIAAQRAQNPPANQSAPNARDLAIRPGRSRRRRRRVATFPLWPSAFTARLLNRCLVCDNVLYRKYRGGVARGAEGEE